MGDDRPEILEGAGRITPRGFSGLKAWVQYVEVLKNHCNVEGRIFFAATILYQIIKKSRRNFRRLFLFRFCRN
ncbi:MAG: hypothetical protein BA864_10000 [Desulfuromonadales bacterium C00003093]|nr:MAG: hypothetical protein BA864_10000 [Desulfuromonadales bacterium C00003093]